MLKKLIINNLKVIESLTIEFSANTKITGRNGVGKTTIKEAITFVLYGRINNSDRIDDSIREGQRDAKVTAVFSINDKDIIITRTRSKAGSKLEINARPSEQSDINALFGSHDEFVSANFVGEFMKFPEVDRRAMLMNLFPKADRAELFKELTGEDPSLVDLDNLEATEKRLKKEKNDKDVELNLLSIQKEQLNTDLFKLKDELVNTEAQKQEDQSDKIAKLVQKTNDIMMSKPQGEDFLPKAPDTSPLTDEINKILEEISKLEKPSDSNMQAIKSIIEIRKSEYDRSKDSTACPTCKRAYENTDSIKTRLNEIELEIKTKFEDYKREKKTYEDALAKYLSRVDDLNIKKANLISERNKLEFDYNTQTEEARLKFQEAIAKWNMDIKVLTEEKEKLSQAQNIYQNQSIVLNSLREKIESTQTRIEAIMVQIKNTDTSLHDRLLKAFGSKGIAFQEILRQEEAVNKLLPTGIRIEFVKQNKTNDGFKPTFNVIRDSIPYQWLSTGMKMEIDMHLLNLFGEGTMLVVDNYESYSGSIPEELKNRQIVSLAVTKKELEINNK